MWYKDGFIFILIIIYFNYKNSIASPYYSNIKGVTKQIAYIWCLNKYQNLNDVEARKFVVCIIQGNMEPHQSIVLRSDGFFCTIICYFTTDVVYESR